MKALMVSAVNPSQPDRGDRVRARHVLEALARCFDVDLALIGGVTDAATHKKMEALCARIVTVPLYKVEVGFGIVRGLATSSPWGMLYSRRLRGILTSKLPYHYDLVLAFQLKTAPLAIAVPSHIRILELTDSLGLYRSLLPRNAEHLRRLSLSGAETEEARWTTQFDCNFVSSERDRAAIRKLAPTANLQVVENGTMPWRAPVRPGVKRNLLFVGNLHYPPNRSGIVYFVHHEWPEIFNKTGLDLRVVGDAPRSLLGAMRVPGVEYVGYVKNLRSEYERALALINPVYYGTGTRSKILEAWAAGLPVISTSAGAAGLEFEAGKHLLIANDASAWSDAIIRLLNVPLWTRLGAAGLQHVNQRYNAERLWSDAMSVVVARAEESGTCG